jgi:hypothetical protein
LGVDVERIHAAERNEEEAQYEKTHFRNEQWQVTNFGIVSFRAAAPCQYQIDAEQLLATSSFDDRQLYDWPRYMVQMPWVKPHLFFEAFKAAIYAHEGQSCGQVDRALLQASFDEALQRAEHPEDSSVPADSCEGRRFLWA